MHSTDPLRSLTLYKSPCIITLQIRRNVPRIRPIFLGTGFGDCFFLIRVLRPFSMMSLPGREITVHKCPVNDHFITEKLSCYNGIYYEEGGVAQIVYVIYLSISPQ